MTNNESFHRLLTEGIKVSYQKDGQQRGDLVWLIDFNTPENNDFIVANQFTVVENGVTKCVQPGSQTFYAVAQNYVETGGAGTAYIYGSLTVKFIGDSSVGIDEPGSDKTIAVYPNPSGDYIQIDGLHKTQNFKAYDTAGKVVHSGTISKNGRVDISSFPKGLYFLDLEDGSTLKFVVE